jgi:hypothetical protein
MQRGLQRFDPGTEIAQFLQLGLSKGGAGFNGQSMCFASVIHQELPVMIQLISHAGAKLSEVSHG